jgi:proliferating cell nuclear antigen
VFFARTSNSAEWKAVGAALKTIVEEATFYVTPEGITFRAMDSSHVALVDLTWPSQSFQTYQCDQPRRFSIRVEDFVKLVNRSENKDSVEIASTEEKTIAMNFSNGYRREFEIHQIESTGDTAPLPHVEFETKAVLTKAVFERILGDISVVADQVTIQASEGKLLFSGKSDVGSAEVGLTKDDADMLEFQTNLESKASYSIDFLNSISKALSAVADQVRIEFSNRKPICLTFSLNSQGGLLQYYLAPRLTTP